MHKPVRISASTLKSWMDNPQQPFVVIDVRDHDTFGVSIPLVSVQDLSRANSVLFL